MQVILGRPVTKSCILPWRPVDKIYIQLIAKQHVFLSIEFFSFLHRKKRKVLMVQHAAFIDIMHNSSILGTSRINNGYIS